MKFMIRISNTPFRPMWSALVATSACTVFTCAVLSILTGAEAQTTIRDIVLMGQDSGKCVRVTDGSMVSGAAVRQWTCDESIGSRWKLKPHSEGPSPDVLVVAGHSGKCLAVAGGSMADDAAIVQSDCTGADSQLWNVSSFGKFYRLIAKHSGKCLNVRFASDHSGEILVQWPCVGAPNETWSFSEGFVGPTQLSRIANASSNLCVDIQHAQVVDNAVVDQWYCTTGAPNQLWALQRASDGYQLKVQSSGKCLAPLAGSAASGVTMVQVPCGPALSQVWSLEAIDATGSNYKLVNNNDLCLDVGGDQVSPDALLVQRPCSGAATQAWRVTSTWDKGSWSSRVAVPIVPVGAAVLKNNKVLFWSSFDAMTWGGGPAVTQTVLYDLATGVATQAQVSSTGHDMFCPGTAMLTDGRVLVNGGSTSWKTSIYDPTANSWANGGDMRIPRGYQGDVLTNGGKVFTIGGSWSGNAGQDRKAEVWSPSSNSWTTLNGIPSSPIVGTDPGGVYRADNHTWLFGIGGGKVFHAGPSAQMNWFDTNGSGSYISAGNRGNSGYSMNGNAVMYDINRILTLGGAPAYDAAFATARAHTINISSGVKVAQTGSLTYARSFANSVVLPDGRVFAAGGQSYALAFSDTTAILAGEVWSPSTGIFSVTAAASIPRTYHSVAVLLPDARVLVGGGGLCGVGCDNNHADFEYYSPSYLFAPDGREAARPAIVNAPAATGYNTQMTVTTSDPSVTGFVLVRMGAATHSVDNDQRRVPLSIAGKAGTSYTVATPTSSGIATPGYYMLFALNAAGVPSKAAIIKVG